MDRDDRIHSLIDVGKCSGINGIRKFWKRIESMKASNDKAMVDTKTIEASEFKVKCLKLMDEVAETGEDIVITRNGRPVSRLVPYWEKPKTLWGIDRGRFEILGDIIEPIDVEWEAETGKIRDSDK